MKILVALTVLSAMTMATSTGFAKDEPYLRADHKILGHQAQSYQQHAQDKAQTLYYYSQAQQPILKTEAKELVEGVRKDLKTSEAALVKLQAEYAKNKEAVDLIESIRKHYAKAHAQCGMIDEACAKPDTDKVVVGDCCSEMYHELEAAKSETDKLLKSLKIGKLEPPRKTAPKAK